MVNDFKYNGSLYMKAILLFLFLSINSFAVAMNTKMIGYEASFPLRGFQIAEYTFSNGKYANYHFNTGLSIGPAMEQPLTNYFSIKYTAKLQYERHNLKEFNRTLSRFSIPADVQINYSMFDFIKIGAGGHFSLGSTLNDTHPSNIDEINSELQTDKYKFTNSFSPIVSVTLFADGFSSEKYAPNRYALNLSYTFHHYSISNYSSNMLLDDNLIDDSKFIISYGNSWITK